MEPGRAESRDQLSTLLLPKNVTWTRLEVKEQCQDTLWVKTAEKDTWERPGILFNRKGSFQQRAEIRSRQER